MPVVNELDGLRAEQLLRRAETASSAFLDALTDEIAIVDGSGTIIAVNEAWKRFGLTEGENGSAVTGVGQNYLDVCTRATDDAADDARSMANSDMVRMRSGERAPLLPAAAILQLPTPWPDPVESKHGARKLRKE